jgi:hypothetical protein
VVVTEDFVRFPQFELMRQVCAAGVVGRIQHVNLFHSGISYHGLALIRSFFGLPYVLSARKLPLGNGAEVTQFQFLNGARGCIVGPYRRDKGSIAVVGSKAVLSDVPGDYAYEGRMPVLLVEPIRANERIRGFAIDTGVRRFETLPAHLPRLETLPFEDKSEMNLLKTCGLIRLLESAAASRATAPYSYLDCLYDGLVPRITSRVGRFVDPLGLGKRSAMHVASALP